MDLDAWEYLEQWVDCGGIEMRAVRMDRYRAEHRMPQRRITLLMMDRTGKLWSVSHILSYSEPARQSMHDLVTALERKVLDD